MRLGITLPTFSSDAAAVIRAARDAEEAGLDGVFVFDHLWPMGSPSRPALSLYPMLAAVLAGTRRIRVGPLVARIGLLPDEVVLASIVSLGRMADGRLLAGIGTGDASSADENEHLGIPYPSARSRRERLAAVAEALRAAGMETWIGAGGPSTNETARRSGATLNLWGAAPSLVRSHTSDGQVVSWAGPLPKDGSAAEVLGAVAAAGATWAVWGWPQSLAAVVAAATEAGIGLTQGAM
ncbi:MAG: LLM class flavin-dependent oxidoreductase [Acidimicrobiales bacterium]